MKKTISYSYLRYLALLIYGTARAYTAAKHQSIYHVTGAELVWVSQSVWLAVLPQLRHTATPLINLYLKKKYPALGIVLADVLHPAPPIVVPIETVPLLPNTVLPVPLMAPAAPSVELPPVVNP
jgi:hypothetical protein